MPLTLKKFNSTGGGGWQPGANTLAYYTLDNDGTNLSTLSSKFSDITLNTATYSTTRTHGTNTYSLYCDGSTYAYIPASTLHEFGTNDLTISVWVYSYTNSGTYTGFISNSPGAYPNYNKAYRLSDRFSGSNNYNFCWEGDGVGQDKTTGISIYNDGWHNCVVTRVNGVFHIYLDSLEKGTITARTDKGIGVNAIIALGYNIVDSTYSKVYMNDLIYENKGWSAQEVSDYYTLTA